VAKLDLSLSEEEMEGFLREQQTARVATVGPDGLPHVVPLWFVWHDGSLYLNSTLGNPTVENLLRTGTAAAVMDDGETYDVLRGVVLTGTVERLGDEAPAEVERTWSDKYLGGNEPPYRRWKNRTWLRLVPQQTASWDFRKIPEARARREEHRHKGKEGA
jgi:nitroimidazol reductase NimA-like FMN-containing flavoprotein (pyridoxamine 5'-phosphate oxidase superfamily)